MEFTQHERNRGIYVFGKTGSGKTTFLLNMITDDIAAGKGVIFIDPHGVDSLTLLNHIPSRRVEDVCFINLADRTHAVSFKPFIEPHQLVTTWVGIWGEKISDRAIQHLLHSLQLLKDNSATTLIELPRIFYDPDFRAKLLANTVDPITLRFWHDIHPTFSRKTQEDAPVTIFNKLDQFAKPPAVRALFGDPRPKFDFEWAMRFNQIVVINIAKGTIGREAASIVGSTILSQIHNIIFEGAISEVNLYVDEFQSFGTTLIADMLSEDRKWGLNATLANQYLLQLKDENQNALLGNVGSLVAFRIGSRDAALIAPEYNYGNMDFTEILKSQEPFNARILRSGYDPYHHRTEPLRNATGNQQKIIDRSRRRFARQILPPAPRSSRGMHRK